MTDSTGSNLERKDWNSWLDSSREFWNCDDSFDAMYLRILTGHGLKEKLRLHDPERLRRMWEEDTFKSVGLILKEVPFRSDWTVLDIGAGIGRLVKAMAARARFVIGIDLSPRMVGHSVRYLREIPHARVVQGDGRSLSIFRDESFDFCYSMLCFQHFPDVRIAESYFREIRRVLKPGGWMRIQTRFRVETESPVSFLKQAVVQSGIHSLWAASFMGLFKIKAVSRSGSSSRTWWSRAETYVRELPFQLRGGRTWRKGCGIGFGGTRFTSEEIRKLAGDAGLIPVITEKGLGFPDWLWITARKPS